MWKKLQEEWERLFGKRDTRVYFAPGRVNLIGEHTDYNGGHVFPCALTIGTYAVVGKNEDHALRLFSVNFPDLGTVEIPLGPMKNEREHGWTNYVKAVVWAFSDAGFDLKQGLDIVVGGNIPAGSGLSSSASLEVLAGTILLEECGWKDLGAPRGVELAKLTQKAENRFIGVNCGIMDQFAIAMGRKNHAVFLNTATLEYQYLPLELSGLKLIISCSNKKRGLADSKYNERRTECENALAELTAWSAAHPEIMKGRTFASLGDLTEQEFEQLAEGITQPVWYKRARHAVTENERTLKAVDALSRGDMVSFGQLMNASHRSLKEDYEVTGMELDTLVESAWQVPGVLGSRMTGAGFGGCTVSLVQEEAIDRFIETVGTTYEKAVGYKADFYVVSAGGGPGRIDG